MKEIQAKKKRNIQHIFWRRFLLYIIVPIFLLMGIATALLFVQNQEEQKENLEVMLENLTIPLEQEIQSGAMKFSQFLLLNDNKVMDLLAQYPERGSLNEYEYYTELDESFSFLNSPDQYIDGAHFYFDSDEEYGYKTYMRFSIEEIRAKGWYQEAKATPNSVVVDIEEAGNYIPSLTDADRAELIYAISLDNYDVDDNLDIGVMFQQCISLKDLENLSGTDYIAYLVDETGTVVFSSEEKYIDGENKLILLDEGESVLYSESKIERLGMDFVLVLDTPSIAVEYFYYFMGILVGGIIIFSIFYLFGRGFFNAIAMPVSDLSKEMQRLNLETTNIYVDENAPAEIQNIQEKYNEMIDRIQKLVEENRVQEQEKHREEMKVLQLQINPHFLSNTLNTIKFMAQVSKHEGIRKMTDNLMQIMDCTFRDHHSMHTLDEEIRILESYIHIMKIRYAESFDLEIFLEETCKNMKIPKLILQPLVENAVFHGLQESAEEGVVRIEIMRQDASLRLVVEDNGCGMSEEMLEKIKNGYETKPGRIGVTNVIKRLHLYYGEYSFFKIESQLGEGTKFLIYIPVGEEEPCIL